MLSAMWWSSDYQGNSHAVCTDVPLVAALQVDPDKAFAVQVVLEESVVNSRVSYVQCALLYTNSNGERRIRWASRHGGRHQGKSADHSARRTDARVSRLSSLAPALSSLHGLPPAYATL
jgi:Sec23/Sec24 beta-sandwich domain